MSFTRQATFSTSIFQAALADYTKITGTDLSQTPFAAAIQQSISPEAILQLFHKREKAFKEYREGNRELINCLTSIVKVSHSLSGILGETVNQIPIPPANALFAAIDTLLVAASCVTSSFNALLELFEYMAGLLKRLEIYTTTPPTTISTEVVVKIIVELLSVLALALKQIKQGRFKKFTRKLLGESEIESVLQRLDRLTQEEARITAAQTLGVVHSLVASIKVVLEDGKVSTDSIRQDLVALHQTLKEINKTNREQLRWEVQQWLSPPDPSTNQNFAWRARLKGTAAWFLNSSVLAEWRFRGSLLWIHGKPGVGKSTLLSAVIQDIKDVSAAGLGTMAYYYFDFRDVKKQDCYGFLSSLISQLAAESDPYYDILSHLYSDTSRGTRKPNIHALKKCMTDMLSLPGQGPVYIIVDAVDECPDFLGSQSPREEVLELIEAVVDLELPNLHLCVASRPNIDIRAVLEPLASLRTSLHEQEGQQEDIIDYIRSVVYSDHRMRRWREEDKRLVVDALSEKADGTFLWAVCQVDRLRRAFPCSIRSILNELPETLDETYSHTLQGIDEEKREYAQLLFRCLTVSIRPLHVEELAEVLSIQFGEAVTPTFNADWRPENPGETVMSVCSALVAIVDRGCHQEVQFSHFSVKEYLTSERLMTAEDRLSSYHILPEPAHASLAHACLSVLLQLDDKIDRNSIAHFPLAPYAARYWVDHAQFRNVSAHLQEAMERLFDSTKPHFAAWVWLYDIDRHWIEPMSTTHPTRPDAVPLYYASLCGFRGLMEYFIVTNSPDLNIRGGSHRTPLHTASVEAHLGVVTVLLNCGADPNSRDNQGRAPLHSISQGRHLIMPQSSLDIARLLVSSGAYVNVTDNQGGTPLHAAARNGYLDLVRLLHGSGASLNVLNGNQETPLHLACGYGKLDISRFLIDCGSDVKSQDKNGCNPLQIASRFGHVDVARLLLNCGSDVNVRDIQRWTPLHYASRYRRLDLARLLIDRGANVNVHGKDHWTGLHFVSHNGHLEIAKLLVDHGANVNSRKDKQETCLHLASEIGRLEIARVLVENGAELLARDDDGWTPFHTASYFGHLHVAEFLLRCGIGVDIRNENEETSFYLASSSGKVDVVRFLIEQGTDIHIKTKSGWNPVHIASQNGHLDVVRRLINTGILIDIRNADQQTPLALASKSGEVEVGRFLIERGADINTRDKRSRSPLHLATQYGHVDMARLLLDHGVDANVRKDNLWSPLHLASAHGHFRVAELLVGRGARVDVSSGKEETPLHLAAGNGEVEISCLLINHGASLRTANNNGWTPLHSAARRGHLGVVKLLLQRGASADALNKANKTAATLASENGQAEIAKIISQYKANTLYAAQYGADENGRVEGNASLHTASAEGLVDIVKSLLEHGSNINARIAQYRTPLHMAAVKGKLEVVTLLIKRGAEVDPCDMWGWVPLHFAARFGHLEVSRVLIDHGANVNARNQGHWTPIHLSAGNGHLGIVKLLLECGADVDAVNNAGETPYQISQAFGYGEIADLLGAWRRAGKQETAQF